MLHRLLRRSLPTSLLGCAIAAAAGAQTTHTVDLVGTVFSPADVTIDVGDTVQWNWVSNFHNVVSGSEGVPNGIFSSGAPVAPPMTFSVTFDQAFLDANPVTGKQYDYYCDVHVAFGMEGTVTVAVPGASSARNGGGNPSSLSDFGPPVIGATYGLAVDLETTGHGLAIVFGLDSPASVTLGGGQTLLCLDLLGGGEILTQGAKPGPTALYLIPIPDDPALCGYGFCVQALHFTGVVPFALSNALDVTIGNV